MDLAPDPAAGTLTTPGPAASGPAPVLVPRGRFLALLLLIMAMALVVRVDALANRSLEVPPVSDATAYHLLGRNLADGRGYIRPYEWEGLELGGIEVLAGAEVVPTAEYPPGLPVVLALATKAGVTSTDGQRLLLASLGVLTVGLIGLVGRRLGGDGVGLLAAAGAAVHPALWNVEVTLMPEPLAALGGAALVFTALAVHDHPSLRRWLALGAVVGAACYIRTELLLAGGIFLVALALHGGRATPSARALRSAAASLAVVVALLAPWTVRNALTFGRFVPMSNNLGSALRGANCDLAYHGPFRGLWVTSVGEGGEEQVDPEGRCFTGFMLGDGHNEADDAARLRSEGLAYVRDHAGELPEVVAARLGRTVGLYQARQTSNFAGAEGRNPAWDFRGTRTFQVSAVLGAVGLVLAGSRRRERWLLLVVPAAVAVVVIVTYGNPRFRAAAEPSVIVLAALGMGDLGRRAANRWPVLSDPSSTTRSSARG